MLSSSQQVYFFFFFLFFWPFLWNAEVPGPGTKRPKPQLWQRQTLSRCVQGAFFLPFEIGFILLFFGFSGPHPWHMEVPRLGVKSELQLPAYTTATAMWDLSRVCYLHHNSHNARSLTHQARPGIEPSYSWIVVGFISTAPQGNSSKCYF